LWNITAAVLYSRPANNSAWISSSRAVFGAVFLDKSFSYYYASSLSVDRDIRVIETKRRRPTDRGAGNPTGGQTEEGAHMATVQVRYIVHDVDAAISFYCRHLGFHEVMHPAPAFAMLSRGDLRLVLSAPNPSGGGGQPMPDGTPQVPGGWNRFAIEVDDLAAMVDNMREAGAHFRNDIVVGVGGKQILLDDPSGNPVELFQPILAEAHLHRSQHR
jgi:catechol 2,3-dioxygenase-like lactoylglutathione lyase family enzyme